MAEAVVYRWPAFELRFRPETGAALTWYPDDRWSGCAPVPEDAYHAERLGITPAEHRLAHELAHHLVGIEVMGAESSPVIWRDAHGVPQPEGEAGEAALEEWWTTAITYFAYRRFEMVEWGAIMDVARITQVGRLGTKFFWLMQARHHATLIHVRALKSEVQR